MLAGRTLALLTLLLGLLGTFICATGIAGVLLIGFRFGQASESAFDTVQGFFQTAEERVRSAQHRVQDSKITTEKISQGLQDWAEKKTGEQIASQLHVEEKTEALRRAAEQTDLWLEISEASLQSMQRVFELVRSMGAPVDAEMITPLAENVASMRSKLKETTENVQQIEALVSEKRNDALEKERIGQARDLAARLAATLFDIDSGMERLADRLSAMESQVRDARVRTHRWIMIVMVGIAVTVTWMAVGQAFLARHGWKRLQGNRSTE